MKHPSPITPRIPPSKKLKLVCSFNGRFRRRPEDNKLRYTGGVTRIISVDPSTLTYSKLRLTIAQVFKPEFPGFSLKYQLPGSDADCPLVLVASDDDVKCMVEEFESFESYGKPSRLWLYVCNGSDEYDVFYDEDNAKKHDGNIVAGVDHDRHDELVSGFGVLKLNLGFREEKIMRSAKGDSGGNRLWKGFVSRNGVNGRRVSDNSLRKKVLKQQLLLAKKQVKQCGDPALNLGTEPNDDCPLMDLGPDAKAGDDLDSNGKLPSESKIVDDNLVEVKNPPMESSMVNSGQGLVVDSVMKQELGFSEGLPSQYLNMENNILPSFEECDAFNSQLSCENQAAGKPEMQKSFHQGLRTRHRWSIDNTQFGLNDVKTSRVVHSSYDRIHRLFKLRGNVAASARIYPGLGACTTISKQGHSTVGLNHPSFSRPPSCQREHVSVEARRLISATWNDRASARLNRATIKKHGLLHHGVNIHSPQVKGDGVIDFSVESRGDRDAAHYEEQLTKATIKGQSRSYDANFSVMNMGSQNVEQVASGVICNAKNPNGKIMHMEGISESTDIDHNGCHPIPDMAGCSVDVSSYNPSLENSLASGEVSALRMAHLKLLDLTVEEKVATENRICNDNSLLSINDTMAEAPEEEMQDHTRKTLIVNDNWDTSRSHKTFSVLNGMPGNLASFYSHLATDQKLQLIKGSDLEYIKELGSGNYGTVYYGKWKGSDVAIKKIKATCFRDYSKDDDRLVADFWKEADKLGQLHHPNIIAFYGVVSEGPITNLATVTEYMINGSLKQVLQRKDRTIDRRKRLIIAMDAAFGIQYLHEKNIVHFDLKSHNLLVNMRDPRRPVCKIGDLGLSKIKQRTLVSGGVRGTIPWMAPELLSTATNLVTEKVDVYSFGIVMWELLTGEEPYADMRSQEILGGIMKGTLRPEIPHWCEPAWRSLMERCWSSDPKSRPSFSEVAKELRSMSADMNIK